jgi:hypothetical protein
MEGPASRDAVADTFDPLTKFSNDPDTWHNYHAQLEGDGPTTC